MKVLLAAHVGYPWGGISQRYSDLLASSLPQKINLTFFESSPNKTSFSTSGMFNLKNILDFCGMLLNYSIGVFRLRPSIVHIACAYGFSFIKHSILVIFANLLGCKVILAPHCSISVFMPKSKLPFLWMRFILNMCDGLIILSSEWLDIKKIAPKLKIKLLKNAIDLSKYLELARRLDSQKKIVKIIFLGHIGEEKGIFDLIQAVKIIKEQGSDWFEVLIYGASLRLGELKQAQETVKNSGLADIVLFREPVFGVEKIRTFGDADIFVLPSHHEGMPISIIEAMAAGLPVVAANVGGIPDLIENSKTGIIVEAKAPVELARALTTLIENQLLRYVYGMAGRQKAIENHDINKYVYHLIEFYQSVI